MVFPKVGQTTFKAIYVVAIICAQTIDVIGIGTSFHFSLKNITYLLNRNFSEINHFSFYKRSVIFFVNSIWLENACGMELFAYLFGQAIFLFISNLPTYKDFYFKSLFFLANKNMLFRFSKFVNDFK